MNKPLLGQGENSIYLGDGAYADFDPDRCMLRIYAHDGINVIGEVWLECDVWERFHRFAHRFFKSEKR